MFSLDSTDVKAAMIGQLGYICKLGGFGLDDLHPSCQSIVKNLSRCDDLLRAFELNGVQKSFSSRKILKFILTLLMCNNPRY